MVVKAHFEYYTCHNLNIGYGNNPCRIDKRECILTKGKDGLKKPVTEAYKTKDLLSYGAGPKSSKTYYKNCLKNFSKTP